MDRVSVESIFPQIVKLDRIVLVALVVATYRTDPTQYVVYKNNKPIAWSISERDAVDLHDMYFYIYKKEFVKKSKDS